VSRESDLARAEAHLWHALTPRQAIAAVGSDQDKGLSIAEAGRRLERFGANALPEPTARSTLSIFMGQFKSPLIYLLMGAACVALALGHRSDAVVIVIVVLINAVIGSFQEGRAERSLEALRKLATRRTRLERGGRESIVDAAEVVPGDILLVDAGDRSPPTRGCCTSRRFMWPKPL
jgi:magnesium-transporting ATPase (P-type)